jgi:hypothetical protein
MAIEITQDTVVKILVRRGTDAERQLVTFTEGELGYCIDTQRVFVGDGVTPGGIVAGNKFLGSINSKTSFNSIAQLGDLIYQTGGASSDAEVLNAYVGGGAQWIDIHPKPYIGTTTNTFASLEKATNGRWRVSNELLGDGFSLFYDDQGFPSGSNDSITQTLNRIDFDSRYISLCAAYSSWYFGNYKTRKATNNLEATVNVDQTLYVNGAFPYTPNQIKLLANDSSSFAVIESVRNPFVIKSNGDFSRLSLFSQDREGYRLYYNDTYSTLNTIFSSENRGNYSNPNFFFIGTTRFSDPVFFDHDADVTIYGNLSVYGDLTYLETIVTTTSALSVLNKNNNTSALYVAQLNAGDPPNQSVAVFKEGQTGRSILNVKERAFVGINTFDNTNFDSYLKAGPYLDAGFNFALSGNSIFKSDPASPGKFRVDMGGGDIYLGSSGGILIDVRKNYSTSYITMSGNLRVSEDVIAFAISDERVKENIKPIENSLDLIDLITGVSFDWKPESGHFGHDYGVLAQEVEKIFPEIVTTRDSGYKAVKYEKLVPLLIQAIKELKAQIKCL